MLGCSMSPLQFGRALYLSPSHKTPTACLLASFPRFVSQAASFRSHPAHCQVGDKRTRRLTNRPCWQGKQRSSPVTAGLPVTSHTPREVTAHEGFQARISAAGASQRQPQMQFCTCTSPFAALPGALPPPPSTRAAAWHQPVGCHAYTLSSGPLWLPRMRHAQCVCPSAPTLPRAEACKQLAASTAQSCPYAGRRQRQHGTEASAARSDAQSMYFSSVCTSVDLGTAPMTVSHFWPSLKNMTVGMLRMPYSVAIPGLSSVFSFSCAPTSQVSAAPCSQLPEHACTSEAAPQRRLQHFAWKCKWGVPAHSSRH